MRKIKDPVSGFTHLAGMVASIVGLVFLIIYSVKYGHDTYDVFS
jgi:predicted membrane channel-forming protein YqfA (hemolysin III family)